MRTGPRHRWLGKAGFGPALRYLGWYYARRHIHRLNSDFAAERLQRVRTQLERGETVYLAGIAAGGMHNAGVALIEVSAARGPRIICNHEEERFSGEKHTTKFPEHALAALAKTMDRIGIGPERIAAWLGTWDYPLLGATMIRSVLEELPGSVSFLRPAPNAVFDFHHLSHGSDNARDLARNFGLEEPVPIIAMPHHENHAWFSFAVSPFARLDEPVAIAVIDGTGDRGSISLYVAEHGAMRCISCNDSVFDSLGIYYSVISSSQGGWTWLSSEGRYMGAAAFGTMDRASNPYYAPLREILSLQSDGGVLLNRALANWQRDPFYKPYRPALTRILGEPIPAEQMWNPDAVLRVEDIKHKPNTKDRLDKAAATQMVFEDALIHIVDHLIRTTQSNRLILTGGVALNALANMRLLDHFDETYFEKTLGRRARLHLWVPPVPSDPGVPVGAAYIFAHLAGAGLGPAIEHAFYCGLPPTQAEIRDALEAADGVDWIELGSVADARGRATIADMMAFMIARDGVLAIFQGAAETGPRALGHRSIVANPCNPRTREVLNARVKYREAIRPLAPMMTLAAAREFFELSDGASDADYNIYNYMVLTARAKPAAHARIPSVIHADGTGRLQIVREHTDPLTYAYLKALGRRIGVEVSVNTSFNVAGPIAQTAAHAVETLRRSKGMDAVLMVAEDGAAFAAWHGAAQAREGGGRFRRWLAEWRAETTADVRLSV